MNSPASISRSIPASASCARTVPAFQILPTPEQYTARARPFRRGASTTAQPSLALGNPEQDTPLQKPQDEIEGEAEQADDHDGEEDQPGIEGVARHRDDLPEPVADAGRLGNEHHHPCAEEIEAKHHEH